MVYYIYMYDVYKLQYKRVNFQFTYNYNITN